MYALGRDDICSIRPVISNWWSLGGETLASISVRSGPTQVVLMYRVQQPGGEWLSVEEPTQIARTPCNRPWFVCPEPSCGRRTAILFITERNFRCRRCCKLSYGSQRESRADRGLRRVQNIRRRLGGGPSLLERFPDKPKGMRWATYDGLREEAQRAEMGVSRAHAKDVRLIRTSLCRRLYSAAIPSYRGVVHKTHFRFRPTACCALDSLALAADSELSRPSKSSCIGA
jgi:hypothetical protein